MPECQLCKRDVSQTTKHHLIPRTRHKNKKNKKEFSRKEVKTRIIDLCRACHSQIHVVLTNKELERDYNTLDLLSTHPEVKKFVDWIKNKPEGIKVAMRKTHYK